ncbi:hypothetical protein M5C72_06185 [Companilactobacillus allii]|uniref:Uncharacterized protein n=1 Tax=Companilactobacillus allii TaxID=1847728 RepID=A0A1P8Q4B8_9LACO|nr:hypothetical protein [Companilactobacillus allii]APX72696.1 hypothetical protein BTM29_09100 [Companilactobacillus allii]USQ69802.1 hypothetical protein M5C72_06185 [Companilactobacillus allii]
MLTQEEYGFNKTGPFIAKRDLNVINDLANHMEFETRKSLDLMKNLQSSNNAYRGNQEVINGLMIMNACAKDIGKELASDLKLFGGGVNNAE